MLRNKSPPPPQPAEIKVKITMGDNKVYEDAKKTTWGSKYNKGRRMASETSPEKVRNESTGNNSDTKISN